MNYRGFILSTSFLASVAGANIQPYVASYPDAPHLAMELAPTPTHGTLISWTDWTPTQVIALLYHLQGQNSLPQVTLAAKACNAHDCVPLRPQGVHAYEDLHTLGEDYRVSGFLSAALPSSWGETFLTKNADFVAGTKAPALNLKDAWERVGFFMSLKTQGDHLSLCPITWSIYNPETIFHDINGDPALKGHTGSPTPLGAIHCLTFPKDVKKETVEEILKKKGFTPAASTTTAPEKKSVEAPLKKAAQKKPS